MAIIPGLVKTLIYLSTIMSLLLVKTSYAWSPENWMRDYREKSASELVWPASHNSGAKSHCLGVFGGKCQSKSITEQLAAGIRFLDIRAATTADSKGPVIVHGILNFGKLKQMFLDVIEFTTRNPTEIVVISLSKEFDRSNHNNGIQDLTNEFQSYFVPAHQATLPIKYFTQRIILLTNLEGIRNSWFSGQHLRSFWSDADCRKCNGDPQKLFDNIIESGYLKGSFGRDKTFRWLKCEMARPLVPVKKMAKAANGIADKILDLAEHGNHYFNVLSTDYVQEGIIRKTIEKNL